MGLFDLLERALAGGADRDAVVDGGARLTWREFAGRAGRLAAGLRARGVAEGDRVAILEPNTHRFLESYFAAAGLGAILNPLNRRQHAEELRFTIGDAGARWLIASSEFAELVAAVLGGPTPVAGVIWTGAPPPRTEVASGVRAEAYEDVLRGAPARFEPAPVPDDAVAHLYYTSGTTGRPKGVMLTHRNVAVHAESAVAELGLGPGDVWGHIAPLFHLADAWATFAITAAGGTHVMLPRFEARAALDLLERERVTLSNLVPTMLNLMVADPSAAGRDWSGLRMILSGGAPIAPRLVRTIMAVFGCEYVQTYGMTETSPYLTMSLLPPHLRALPPEDQLRWRAKTGRPFRGVELRVVRDDGAPVAADGREVGEIQVRGPTVTPGYWNRPEETARAFTDGWLRTGDLAVLDGEGFVDIVDRKKDMIITGGEKVYSTEVEHVLHEHPAVLEVAVYGTSDEVWGEIVTAAVVPRAPVAAEDLLAFCRARLAGYKVPKRVVFLPELPKTGSGKISKHLLRETSVRCQAPD